MIKCEICGRDFLSITYPHLRLHNITIAEYKVLYPQAHINSSETISKMSLAQKILHSNPNSSYNSSGCRKKNSEAGIKNWANPEYRKKILGTRNDPSSAFHSPEYIKKQSEGTREMWVHPNSSYNSPEYRKKNSDSKIKAWANPKSKYNSSEYRKKNSEGLRKAWADPNSTFNTSEFQEKFNEVGYGKRGRASDGHHYESLFELIFEEWLIVNELEHEPHPRLPNSGKRADQLVNGRYVEIDGMYRTEEYWKNKYDDTGINPIIVMPKELTKKFLDDNFLELLGGINLL